VPLFLLTISMVLSRYNLAKAPITYYYRASLRCSPQETVIGPWFLSSGITKNLNIEIVDINMKTFSAKPAEVKREWFVVDATDKVLGRVATEIALRLRGKHKPEYTPHVDTGDHIVVINAEKIAVTGNKEEGKIYYRHTGFPGGIKDVNVRQLRERAPTRIIENAVRGMLPKNPLGRAMFKKLHIYAGPEHKHQAQEPTVLEL